MAGKLFLPKRHRPDLWPPTHKPFPAPPCPCPSWSSLDRRLRRCWTAPMDSRQLSRRSRTALSRWATTAGRTGWWCLQVRVRRQRFDHTARGQLCEHRLAHGVGLPAPIERGAERTDNLKQHALKSKIMNGDLVGHTWCKHTRHARTPLTAQLSGCPTGANACSSWLRCMAMQEMFCWPRCVLVSRHCSWDMNRGEVIHEWQLCI